MAPLLSEEDVVLALELLVQLHEPEIVVQAVAGSSASIQEEIALRQALTEAIQAICKQQRAAAGEAKAAAAEAKADAPVPGKTGRGPGRPPLARA